MMESQKPKRDEMDLVKLKFITIMIFFQKTISIGISSKKKKSRR